MFHACLTAVRRTFEKQKKQTYETTYRQTG